jgi:hypothetical protein
MVPLTGVVVLLLVAPLAVLDAILGPALRELAAALGIR